MFDYKIDEEVSLKLFTVDDAEEFYNLTVQSKDYLKEWIGWIDSIKSVEDTIERIKGRIQDIVETGGYPKSVLIFYKGEIAGTIGFNFINKRNKSGQIGYWLGEQFQGKGIMTRAFAGFIEYGIKVIGLNRIEVRIADGNKKSRALPERLGFTEEGRIRQAEWLHDHYVDHIVYGLLAEEWK